VTVIDVHTHMLTRDYLALLAARGGPVYEVRPDLSGREAVHVRGAPLMTLYEPMWDYDLRIAAMDAARVDIAIVSLTTPNAFFGDAETSLAAASGVNDSMAAQQRARPDRIRWLASLPWQHEALALAELERALGEGACGVMVTANIDGVALSEERFAAIWRAIDTRALPVLMHPAAPPGAHAMGLDRYGLMPGVGFPFDTTLAIANLIYSGFLDRHPRLNLIVAHGGGALPFLAGRLDRCHAMIPAAAEQIAEPPSLYLERLWYDAVVYSGAALEACIATAGSDERVLYGSDYPHNIGDMEGCLARVDALPAASARRIRGANARQLFNL
jgi:aminocarboxymuconate-semialdehyde decarboxylase